MAVRAELFLKTRPVKVIAPGGLTRWSPAIVAPRPPVVVNVIDSAKNGPPAWARATHKDRHQPATNYELGDTDAHKQQCVDPNNGEDVT